jgi:hypothetical protein
MMRAMFLAGLLFCVAGCGGDGTVTVEGTVTLDNTPVPEGDILFIPEDKQFGAEAGKIKDGAYSLKARSGKNRVEIRAMREVPGKKGPMGNEAVYEPIIPPQYNEKSKLSAEVSSDKRKFPFELKSK